MKEIEALRARRAELARNMLALNEAHKASWGPEQQAKWDELSAEEGRVRDQISRAQQILDLDAEKAFADVTRRDGGRPEDKASAMALVNKWARGGDRALSAEEWGRIQNTMSTTTAGEGGYTVATEVAVSIADALKLFGGMRSVAEVIQTSAGNTINYPTSDGTAETGEQIAENTTATDLDPSFGTIALTPYKYSSKVVTIPFELLQDSAVNMEAFIKNRLMQRIGRITNTKFTTGSGNSEPKGIVTAASLGKTGAAGQVTSVIHDDIVDLEYSVDAAYRQLGRCRYMGNDAVVKVIRKLKDSAGRPLWIPSYDGGIVKGTPDMLNGYPVTINNDVAVPAASAKSLLFGDMSFYKVRDVLDIQLFRFTDSAYAKKGQVGFMLWMRCGGTMVDVGGAVKYYAHPAA